MLTHCFTSTPCLSSSLLPSSFIIVYLSSTPDGDHVSKAIVFWMVPYVSSYRWVHFSRVVLFCQSHQQLFTHSLEASVRMCNFAEISCCREFYLPNNTRIHLQFICPSLFIHIGHLLLIAVTLRVQSARGMWPSSLLPPCCLKVWCAAGLLSTTHFVLLFAEVYISAVHVQLFGL